MNPKHLLYILFPICLILLGNCEVYTALGGDTTIIVENRHSVKVITRTEIFSYKSGNRILPAKYTTENLYNNKLIGANKEKSWIVPEGTYEVEIVLDEDTNHPKSARVTVASGENARFTYTSSGGFSPKKE
jgi:hypothetical protein